MRSGAPVYLNPVSDHTEVCRAGTTNPIAALTYDRMGEGVVQ